MSSESILHARLQHQRILYPGRSVDARYSQSHLPLHDQDNILGHSVRALYLTTAAADLGGAFLEDAKRLLADTADHKMYQTGGIGSEPRFEGFHEHKYRLPQSTAEGGCYAETCASIAAMMTAERVLSWELDGKVRDTMELCLLNAVLGGGSLNGKQFSYANKHATCGDETALRNDWFEGESMAHALLFPYTLYHHLHHHLHLHFPCFENVP